MYIQFQFKSFYKVTNRSILNSEATRSQFLYQNKDRKDICPVHINFYTFFFLIFLYVVKTKPFLSSMQLDVNNNNPYFVSVFVLPTQKKSVMFLRAPYKNKLARLNILNIEYTTIITLCSNVQQRPKSLYGFTTADLSTFRELGKSNLSTHKAKHIKTKIVTTLKYEVNYLLSNY